MGVGAAVPSAGGGGGGGGGPPGPRLAADPLGPGGPGGGGAAAAAPLSGVGGWLATIVWPFAVRLCASKLVCPAITLWVPLT
jgi:hypothetical protein